MSDHKNTYNKTMNSMSDNEISVNEKNVIL